MLGFYEYQQESKNTAFYPKNTSIPYCALGLCGEAGEVAEKVKKVMRDKSGNFGVSETNELVSEMGDVLWYLSQLATELGVSLGDIALENLCKLQSRQRRGKLGGSGDNR